MHRVECCGAQSAGFSGSVVIFVGWAGTAHGLPDCRSRSPRRGSSRHPDHPIVSVDRKPEPCSDPAATIDKPNSYVASPPTSPRVGTKIAQVIELLQRGEGATLA